MKFRRKSLLRSDSLIAEQLTSDFPIWTCMMHVHQFFFFLYFTIKHLNEAWAKAPKPRVSLEWALRPAVPGRFRLGRGYPGPRKSGLKIGLNVYNIKTFSLNFIKTVSWSDWTVLIFVEISSLYKNLITTERLLHWMGWCSDFDLDGEICRRVRLLPNHVFLSSPWRWCWLNSLIITITN